MWASVVSYPICWFHLLSDGQLCVSGTFVGKMGSR